MTIYAGDAVNGTTLTLHVDTRDSFALSGITSSEFTVTDPDGIVRPWAWTLSSATAGEVIFTHTFSNGRTEAPLAGDYIVTGWVLTGTTRTRGIDPCHIPFERYT